MIKLFFKLSISFVLVFSFFSCDEDFDLVTEYTDQTVVYAFIEHKDPWVYGQDTNFIVVNKAFLGEANIYDMAAAPDSTHYKNYDSISVTLQRIETVDPNSTPIGNPIVLSYTTHYKDSGAFSRENNVVFYTTHYLMDYQDVNLNPTPDPNQSYFYRLSIKKPGQAEVYAVTKMIRGFQEGKPFTLAPPVRIIKLYDADKPNHKLVVKFGTNVDARIYQLHIRTYYYEKRTDGNIYIDYFDYDHPLIVSSSKNATQSEDIETSVTIGPYLNKLLLECNDTSGVVWRAIKNKTSSERPETHAMGITLGSQETYVYNQITQPSNGIVQTKPNYTNITNGLGIFTSKWNFWRNQFTIEEKTINYISEGDFSKHLKFMNATDGQHQMDVMDHSVVIKRY